LNYLHAKDNEFRAFYNEISLQQLSENQKRKNPPVTVDATSEELKIAL
jgi:hypothetical protein